MKLPQKIRIVDVGARDGLQNEKKPLSVETKVAFINMLTEAGLQTIEAGAFVSPKWVPQMADTDKVLAAIHKRDGVSYPVLVPNEKGMQAALDAGATEVAVFAAASESFSLKNINCTINDSLLRFEPVMKMAAAANVKVRGYVSCVLGCPYEGEITPDAVLPVARAMRDMGCYEISLGDTIGTGTPVKTEKLLAAILPHIGTGHLAVHFHDTYGQALANILVALQAGIGVIDSAAGGLGGCPYAQGATGNVASEDVLYMLSGMGIDTGVDMDKLAAAGRFIADSVGKPLESRVGQVLQKRN